MLFDSAQYAVTTNASRTGPEAKQRLQYNRANMLTECSLSHVIGSCIGSRIRAHPHESICLSFLKLRCVQALHVVFR